MEASATFLTADSVLYDAVFIPGGQRSTDSLKARKSAKDFVSEAFSHYKAIGASGEGKELLTLAAGTGSGPGLIPDGNHEQFLKAVAEHVHWDRKI